MEEQTVIRSYIFFKCIKNFLLKDGRLSVFLNHKLYLNIKTFSMKPLKVIVIIKLTPPSEPLASKYSESTQVACVKVISGVIMKVIKPGNKHTIPMVKSNDLQPSQG